MICATKAEKWKKEAALLFKAAGIRMYNSDVEVKMILHPRMNKDGTASQSRIDIDNPIKVAIDSLKGYAYADDKQVVKVSSEIGPPIKGGGLTVTIEQHGNRHE